MKKLFFIILCLPLISYTQNEDFGIKWTKGLTWLEVKEKAKRENKYIFIDCFATWCSPCKVMDKEVYTNDSVGKYLNGKFLSVKMQMDQTATDDDAVRNSYPDAQRIKSEYNITAYPTFIFISPDGRLVHKAIGFKKVNDFYSIAQAATSPSLQYYTLMSKYREGKNDLALLKTIILQAKESGENEVAMQVGDDYFKRLPEAQQFTKENISLIRRLNKHATSILIARKYITQYLNNLDESSFCTRDNLNFFKDFFQLISSNDQLFKLCFTQKAKVDIVFGIGGADRIIKYVIGKEEIAPQLYKNGIPIKLRPNWKYIGNVINKKYGGQYVEELIPVAKETFYRKINNWKKYVNIIDDKISKALFKSDDNSFGSFGPAFALNNWAWDIFQHCNERKYLKRALRWVELAIVLEKKSNGYMNDFDTKANLLYKLGRRQEAIQWEEKALKAEEDRAKELNQSPNTTYQQTIVKMQKGEPTWLK